jgi:hypothetical protein
MCVRVLGWVGGWDDEGRRSGRAARSRLAAGWGADRPGRCAGAGCCSRCKPARGVPARSSEGRACEVHRLVDLQQVVQVAVELLQLLWRAILRVERGGHHRRRRWWLSCAAGALQRWMVMDECGFAADRTDRRAPRVMAAIAALHTFVDSCLGRRTAPCDRSTAQRRNGVCRAWLCTDLMVAGRLNVSSNSQQRTCARVRRQCSELARKRRDCD